MGLHEDLMAISARFDQALTETLEADLADATKKQMQEVLEQEVYSYEASPFFMSTRRGENDGLKDTENMESHVEDGDTLYVENVAQSQSLWEETKRPLTPIVEEGLLNYGPNAGEHHFHEDTEKQMIESGQAEAVILSGLKKRGF